MVYRNMLLAACMLLFSVYAFAQLRTSGGEVRGNVMDTVTGDPMEYATISLYRAGTDSLVSGIITSSDGSFALEKVPPGRYDLKLDFVGYKPRNIGGITISRDQRVHDVGTVKLVPSGLDLDEVTITGKREEMQFELDKRIFHVGEDITNLSTNAAEILDNMPSVEVDAEGNVSLRGSDNVRILIDGKPSSLAGLSEAEALRMLQGNMIERVEIITNPSARYEAEGTAGIINIVLKEKRKSGVNGTIDVNTGYPHNHGVTGNLNYNHKNKLNIYGNAGFTFYESWGSGSGYQEFYETNGPPVTRRERTHSRIGWSANGRLGADYRFDDRHRLAANVLYSDRKRDEFTELNYEDFNASDQYLHTVTRVEDELDVRKNVEANLNYEWDFEKEDQKLTADVRFTKMYDREDAFIAESATDPSVSTVDNNTVTNENQYNLLLQTDYTHPFGEDGKLEGGLRSTIRRIDNDFFVEEQLPNGEWAEMTEFTNRFIYDEHIHAAYGIVSNKHGSFTYQVGTRLEVSDVTTRLVQTEELNPRLYPNLFPSAHTTLDLEGDNQLQLSYSRRINRPRSRSLNPFFSFSDARNFYAGNPHLNPELTHSFEFGHLKYWDDASLYTGLYYRYTDDKVQRIRTVDEEGMTFIIPRNLGHQESYGVESNFSVSPFRWWRLSSNLNFYRAVTRGEHEGLELHADAYTMRGRFTSNMTLPKGFVWQTTFNYRAPREIPQGRALAIYYLNLGISKHFWDKKATLVFSVRDLFNTRRWRSITEGDNFYSESSFQWRVRQFKLTFTYRINQQQPDQRQERRGGGYDMDDGMGM